MRFKPLITATVLIALGVVMGVVLVSNYGPGEVAVVNAADRAQRLGADAPPVVPDGKAQAFSDAFVKVSNTVTPQVVSITVHTESDNPFFGRQPREAGGSGVIISKNGYVVTNNHVVESAKEGTIRVKTHEREEYTAELIGRDELTDLALLKIEAENLSPAFIGNSDEVKVGEWVVAVGNPLGLRSTITAGIISAIGRGHLGLNRDEYAVENFLQTDAAINPGNSGGGLFDLQGRLVGINTAIASRTGYYQGYGFAIPSNLVRSVIDDLLDDGSIDRGYIGVGIQSVDAADAKAFGLPKVQGVKVLSVLPGSAGEKAGILASDVILEVDGEEVYSSNELQSIVAQHRAGDRLELVIWRDGKRIAKDVRLQPRDQDDTTLADASPGDDTERDNSDEPVEFENLGFTVKSLSRTERDELEVDNGVVVSSVDPFGPVARNGKVFKGDVIVQADRKKIETPYDLKRVISSKEPGGAVLLYLKTGKTMKIEGVEIPQENG